MLESLPVTGLPQPVTKNAEADNIKNTNKSTPKNFNNFWSKLVCDIENFLKVQFEFENWLNEAMVKILKLSLAKKNGQNNLNFHIGN